MLYNYNSIIFFTALYSSHFLVHKRGIYFTNAPLNFVKGRQLVSPFLLRFRAAHTDSGHVN